jgi:hypothetical protein
MSQMNYYNIYEVFAELAMFVNSEPRLSDFSSKVSELADQALAVARGQRVVPAMDWVETNRIADISLAREIVAIVNKVPQVDSQVVDAETIQIVGQLMGNLVAAITHAVLRDFPEVVRGGRDL